MKREISNLVGTNLGMTACYSFLVRPNSLLWVVSITGNPKAVMQYANYEEAIVLKYGIELIGWTHDKFSNPSELSNALEPLRTLLEALNNQSCKFVKLSFSEHRAREAKYRADIASGAIAVKQRKTRKDAGTKRKGPNGDDATDTRPGKRIRSEEMVNDSDDDTHGE
jgi:hypothetical protein